MSEAATLLKDLKAVNANTAQTKFTSLFKRGVSFLGYTNDDAARSLKSSERNIRRWKKGEKVPPSAEEVLLLLKKRVETYKPRALPKNPVKVKVPARWAAIDRMRKLPRANTNYPTTCTTFWKQMEPSLHALMDQALQKTGIKPDSKHEYRGVTRRIYRAVVISAMNYLQKKTKASRNFLQNQSNEAQQKALRKLFDGKEDMDAGTDIDE